MHFRSVDKILIDFLGFGACLIVLSPLKKGTSILPTSHGFVLVYYTSSISLNVILTILIVIRLLWYRKTMGSIFGKGSIGIYLSATSILVESQVLYATSGVAFLILYSMNTNLGAAMVNVPGVFTVSVYS